MTFKESYQEMSRFTQAVGCVSIGMIYIVASSSLIHLNKWMMTHNRFPYPSVLCSFHMASAAVITWLLYFARPSLFPAMKGLRIDARFLLKFVPLGICFAASIMLSNTAYKYLSVALIQMLKESSCAMVYTMSLALKLETFSWTAIIILGLVVLGATVATYGEIHFVWIGIVIQIGSQVFEVSKVCMQNILMSSNGGKLDPLTAVLFMAPSCFLVSLIVNYVDFRDTEASQVEIIQQAWAHWPQLLLSCFIAVSLNVIIATQICLFNAVGFVLTGVMKDIVIVAVSAFYVGESISRLQFGGFGLATIGCIAYSTYKMNMHLFQEDDILQGFSRLWQKVKASHNENTKLLEDPKPIQKAFP
jgi:hypothetical protein